MDATEFFEWRNDLFRKFPVIRSWMQKLPPGREGSKADVDLLHDWHDVLATCQLAHCLQANAEMLAGELDGPGAHPAQWQQLPALIVKHAKRIARRGMVPRSAPSTDYGPTFRCLRCEDSGYVWVAPHWAITDALAGKLDPRRNYDAVMGCTCERGAAAVEADAGNQKVKVKLLRFDSRRDFLIPLSRIHLWSFHDESIVSEFVAWCHAQREAAAQARVQRMFPS